MNLHVLPHLQEICNEVYILDKGNIVYNCNCQGEGLEEIFLKYVTKDGNAQ